MPGRRPGEGIFDHVTRRDNSPSSSPTSAPATESPSDPSLLTSSSSSSSKRGRRNSLRISLNSRSGGSGLNVPL